MHKLRTIEMHRLTVGEFKESAKIPLIVVLDDVRSAYNVGSVFRTCDAFRIEKVCLCGITATPPSTEIHKTALGGEDSVDWEYFKDTADCVRKLHAQGYFVWSIEQVEHSVKLQNLDAQSCIPTGLSDAKSDDETKFQGVAVILGNEVKGVRQDIVDMSDGCLEIPQYGTKHSLNVSITAGIVIWEFAKRLIPEFSKDK
jgi:tRNA G18 (ribose-2'-O)-methylase SpoU